MEKYEKIRVVGRGAYGTVFLCRRILDEKLVIVKQIPVEQMTKEERQASLNESKVLSMLDHPNIISYYENFLEDKSIVIVMEYAPGGTLFEHLQHRDVLLSEEDVLYYFAQIVLAIHHIHSRQILHRDMKSQNILLNESKDIIKIGDFGISKILSSKSKAYTVVGTPCYISPELCEGKPYNQKSDIWALGCVLYELLTLKRPFEATNLHALVVKIMKGTFDPVAEHYSSDLRQLLFNMLHLDPSRRPTTSDIMAQPFMINSVYRLFVDIGCLPCVIRPQRLPSSSSSSSSQLDTPAAKHSFSEEGSVNKVVEKKPVEHFPQSYVVLWQNTHLTSSCLPLLSHATEITSVAVGGGQKVGLIKGGHVISWEIDELDNNNSPSPLVYIPRILIEKDAISVTHVACGKDFTALLTDNGILLTYGSGALGCLGHGNYHDVTHPKIINGLLDMNITYVSCGASHVVAVTEEHDVFAWGEGTNGRLGLGKVESQNSPKKVPISTDFKPKLSFCGHDCSFLVTNRGKLMACGSNRHNKLAMDTEDGHHIDEAFVFTPVSSDPFPHLTIDHVSVGSSHTSILSSGDVYTVGSNIYGQLGWGSWNLTHSMPGRVDSFEAGKVTHIACADSYSVAVVEGRKVYMWGRNIGDQGGGDATTIKPQMVPLPVKSNCTLAALSCDGDTTIAALTTVVEESAQGTSDSFRG